MIRVILESPYAGDIERNIAYARECVKHSLSLGEAPIASHLLYTQEGILNDDIPEQRALGIDAGLAWKDIAEKHVFYVDYGWSEGMKYAQDYATKNRIPVEIRSILKQVKTCNKPAVIVPLPDEDEITNAFVSVREQNLKMKLDYRDRDYFGLGVSFVGNWQTAKGNEL